MLTSTARSQSTAPAPAPAANFRYGAFDLLDSRSKYDTNWFPEPLNFDEFDADQEVRASWAHAEKRDHQTDDATVEIEKSFNLLTVEVELPYERDALRDPATGDVDRAEGVGSIEIAARHPFYQWVSNDQVFDLTLGARVELAIPTWSQVSQNTELVGAVYQTLGIGEHFSFQAGVGYSTLFGPNEDGDAQSLEYAGVFGYNIDLDKTLGVVRLTPTFELDGDTGLNHGDSGSTEFSGAAGMLVSFDSIRGIQPKFQIGYLFPLNDTARDDFHWGVVTSLILEY